LKYRAVVFDMFGTLVSNFSKELYRSTLTEIAEAVGAPPDEFHDLWQSLFAERMTGQIRSPEGLIDHICGILEVRPDEGQRRRGCEIRLAMTRNSIQPQPDTLEVLQRLKADSYGTALVSDCTHELPGFWDELPLAKFIDVPVFSCAVGLMKPDPAIYRLAADGLGVEPAECLYVGDGIGQELPGAAEVGMTPVMIRTPDYSTHPLSMPVADWPGHRVSSLTEILGLLV
jgi:putative hydrolase of the HAD superfamily